VNTWFGRRWVGYPGRNGYQQAKYCAQIHALGRHIQKDLHARSFFCFFPCFSCFRGSWLQVCAPQAARHTICPGMILINKKIAHPFHYFYSIPGGFWA